MKQDKNSVRYLVKTIAAISVAVINLFLQLLLPKALSVEEYGCYIFNLNIFTALVEFITLQVPTALVTKLSKRNEDFGLISFYLIFSVFILILSNFFLLVLYKFEYIRNTFSGQSILVVVLALDFAFVTKFFSVWIWVFDAYAIVRFPSSMQVISKVSISIVTFVIFCLGMLSIKEFYLIQIILQFLCLSIMVVYFMSFFREKYGCFRKFLVKNYVKEYFIYCKPLFISSFLSQFIVLIMNWALVHWGGVRELAYFGIAWQLNMLVAFLFTSLVEVSKRDFALSYLDLDQQKNCFIKYFKLTIWLVSFVTIFIAFFSDSFLPVFFGDKYIMSYNIIFIIMLYTIFQAGNQIMTSFLLSIERTKMIAILGVVSQVIAFITVLLFQCPSVIFQNGLGAVGIGISYLLSSLVSSILIIYFIGKNIRYSRIKLLGFYFFPGLLCFFICMVMRRVSMVFIINNIREMIIKDSILVLFYILIVSMIVLKNPKFIGVNLYEILMRRISKIISKENK